MNPTRLQPKRGEIWEVRFDPSEGDEIRKVRPAVIMDIQEAGRMRLHIVVPVTGWKPQFTPYFWMVYLVPTSENGLAKESAADSFQIRSVSTGRLAGKIGMLINSQVDEIAKSIAVCIGFRAP